MYIAVRILLLDPKAALNRVAALLLLSFFIWSFGMSFMSNPMTPENVAGIVWHSYSIGWIIYPFFGLLQSLIMSRRDRIFSSPLYMSMLFLPVPFFFILHFTGMLTSAPYITEYGWRVSWHNTFGAFSFYGYYLSYTLVSLYVLLQYSLRSKNKTIKKAGFIIVGGALLTLLFGTILEVILPRLISNEIFLVKTTDISILIWAFSLLYAVNAQVLFRITPASAADKIIASMNESLTLLNDYFEIVYVNEEAIKLLGYKKEEMIGKPYSSLFASRDDANSWIKKALLTDSIKGYETTLLSSSGAAVDILLSVSIIKEDNDIAGAVCIASDIRPLKRSSEELKVLHTAVEQSPASVVITDIGGSITYVNPKFCSVTGYTKQEALGQNPRILNSGEKPREEYSAMWKKLLSGDEWHGIFHNKKKNGELFWESVSISPIKNSRGGTISFIAIKEDITEQRKAEDELKSSYTKLKELDSLKQNFTSMVSHELRTPITSINGFLSFLLSGVGGHISPQQKDFLESIKANSDRLLRLINDLLDTAKMEAGSFSITKKRTDLSTIVLACSKDIRSLLSKKRIGLFLDGIKDPVYADVDDYRVSQSLINLLNNAIKFSPFESTITIKIKRLDGAASACPAYADTSHLKKGPHIFISVNDQGSGIENDKLLKIFERYYQVENINTRSAQGTGLGLNIVKNIVDLHGGAVWAESQGKGRGSTFVMLIPER
jgi:PAS domain S-box-containing protein